MLKDKKAHIHFVVSCHQKFINFEFSGIREFVKEEYKRKHPDVRNSERINLGKERAASQGEDLGEPDKDGREAVPFYGQPARGP